MAPQINYVSPSDLPDYQPAFFATSAKADDDGNIWILGRTDDVMNVSGHRISTSEVESALVDHPAVAEAARTYAFVIDSGVANTTGDLNLNTTWSKSFIPGETAFQDGLGHGTHVAGTIGALVNGVGVVGVVCVVVVAVVFVVVVVVVVVVVTDPCRTVQYLVI